MEMQSETDGSNAPALWSALRFSLERSKLSRLLEERREIFRACALFPTFSLSLSLSDSLSLSFSPQSPLRKHSYVWQDDTNKKKFVRDSRMNVPTFVLNIYVSFISFSFLISWYRTFLSFFVLFQIRKSNDRLLNIHTFISFRKRLSPDS